MNYTVKAGFGVAVVKQEKIKTSGGQPASYLTNEEWAISHRFAKQRKQIENKRNAFVESAADLYDRTVGNPAAKAIQEDCKQLTGHRPRHHKDSTGVVIRFYCILCYADLG